MVESPFLQAGSCSMISNCPCPSVLSHDCIKADLCPSSRCRLLLLQRVTPRDASRNVFTGHKSTMHVCVSMIIASSLQLSLLYCSNSNSTVVTVTVTVVELTCWKYWFLRRAWSLASSLASAYCPDTAAPAHTSRPAVTHMRKDHTVLKPCHLMHMLPQTDTPDRELPTHAQLNHQIVLGCCDVMHMLRQTNQSHPQLWSRWSQLLRGDDCLAQCESMLDSKVRKARASAASLH